MQVNKRLVKFILGIMLVGLLGVFVEKNIQFFKQRDNKMTKQASLKESSQSAIKKNKRQQHLHVDWRKPSMKKTAYPSIAKHPNLWIHVSLRKQRVYLIDKDKCLYTMYASTGKPGKTATPKGVYHIQGERGDYFYSQSEDEGAYYWVSWKNHGEFLFHSTPTDAEGKYLKSVAADLGKRPSSHGCVHLTVADAKWMYENIPYGTKVVID
ncbi:L,D-transpeptidase [Liquorilactobacillus capillatus]|uniref:L,D-TPase catalytic domain-containing protein n=1 Tax=Liquorilactobacillus capillatus DSM 19910 TaxID=1423731 RepID=A0A0R1M275_9LACO|nr:L,D-transpeptidase [Liquorilactobacillus capillatus]KRL02127.1 hypothetical protein FC81_GL000890 [Liquorilactobacillus capillatus DSM 19910]